MVEVEMFLVTKEAEGYQPKTLRWHTQVLSEFVTWLAENNHSSQPKDWNAYLFRSYILYLQTRPAKRGGALSPSTVTNYVQSLKAFTHWLELEGIVDVDPAARVKKPTPPKLVKIPFSEKDLHLMYQAVQRNRRTGLRSRVIVSLFLDTGMRAGELLSLTEESFLRQQLLVKVFGKGQKERVVPIHADTWLCVQRYMKSPLYEPGSTLIQTAEHKPMSPQALARILNDLGKAAHVDHIHPHRFRHTFALMYLRNGGSPLILQRILGHTTLTMTNRYVAMTTSDLSEQHRVLSPVNLFH